MSDLKGGDYENNICSPYYKVKSLIQRKLEHCNR